MLARLKPKHATIVISVVFSAELIFQDFMKKVGKLSGISTTSYNE